MVKKTDFTRARMMAQELRGLTVTAEDLGNHQHPHGRSQLSHHRGFSVIFWLLREPGVFLVHRHMWRLNTHTHKYRLFFVSVLVKSCAYAGLAAYSAALVRVV